MASQRDTILRSTLIAGIPPAPLILAPDFLWFLWSGNQWFQWFAMVVRHRSNDGILHTILKVYPLATCKLGNVIDRPLAPFSEGFGPFTIISCHKIQDVNSNLTSNLKNCNFQKGSVDYNAVPNILYRPYEADLKESG